MDDGPFSDVEYSDVDLNDAEQYSDIFATEDIAYDVSNIELSTVEQLLTNIRSDHTTLQEEATALNQLLRVLTDRREQLATTIKTDEVGDVLKGLDLDLDVVKIEHNDEEEEEDDED